MTVWIEFSLCALVILYAGSRLSQYGDTIAEKTGLGKSWVGLVLLATVTSLPELITSVSSVTFNDLPDLAVSGILGSCMFNMTVIALLDLVSKHRPVSHMVHQGHVLSAGFGMVLIGFTAIDIICNKYLPRITPLNSVDPISLIHIAVYLLAMRLVFSFEKKRMAEFAGDIADASDLSKHSLRRAILMFLLHSCLIVVAACRLPELADKIGALTGWGQSFIGSSLIAITTSLPEVTVSVAAARLGSFDMAVANLLGSNLFNIAILAITDFCYVKAPLLHSISIVNALTALSAIICTAIVVIGLTYRSEKKFVFLAGDAAAILLVYVLANVLAYLMI